MIVARKLEIKFMRMALNIFFPKLNTACHVDNNRLKAESNLKTADKHAMLLSTKKLSIWT